MPEVKIDAADAAELAEMLRLIYMRHGGFALVP
jgi:hypothetical protein